MRASVHSLLPTISPVEAILWSFYLCPERRAWGRLGILCQFSKLSFSFSPVFVCFCVFVSFRKYRFPFRQISFVSFRNLFSFSPVFVSFCVFVSFRNYRFPFRRFSFVSFCVFVSFRNYRFPFRPFSFVSACLSVFETTVFFFASFRLFLRVCHFSKLSFSISSVFVCLCVFVSFRAIDVSLNDTCLSTVVHTWI